MTLKGQKLKKKVRNDGEIENWKWKKKFRMIEKVGNGFKKFGNA